jgi:hypothetical protein
MSKCDQKSLPEFNDTNIAICIRFDKLLPGFSATSPSPRRPGKSTMSPNHRRFPLSKPPDFLQLPHALRATDSIYSAITKNSNSRIVVRFSSRSIKIRYFHCRFHSQAELWFDFRVAPLKSETSIVGVKARQNCGSTYSRPIKTDFSITISFHFHFLY